MPTEDFGILELAKELAKELADPSPERRARTARIPLK
jgi:hypothetical protein